MCSTPNCSTFVSNINMIWKIPNQFDELIIYYISREFVSLLSLNLYCLQNKITEVSKVYKTLSSSINVVSSQFESFIQNNPFPLK